MRARYIKFGIWVVALVAVWNLGQSYTVTNSLFLFAAAGVVPGTDIALAPNEVMLLLGIVLVVSVLLIFGTNIGRRLRAMFRNAAHDVAVGIEAADTSEVVQHITGELPVKPRRAKKVKAAKVPKPKPVVIIKPQKRPSRALLFLYIAWGAFSLAVRTRTARLRFRLQQTAAAMAIRYDAARAVARRAGLRLRAVIIRFIIIVCRAAIRFWRWLEPYLRTFDAWLGAQYHLFLENSKRTAKRNETVKILLGFMREVGKIVAGVRAEIRAAWSRVAEK